MKIGDIVKTKKGDRLNIKAKDEEWIVCGFGKWMSYDTVKCISKTDGRKSSLLLKNVSVVNESI